MISINSFILWIARAESENALTILHTICFKNVLDDNFYLTCKLGKIDNEDCSEDDFDDDNILLHFYYNLIRREQNLACHLRNATPV